jgi:hypothetical protein
MGPESAKSFPGQQLVAIQEPPAPTLEAGEAATTAVMPSPPARPAGRARQEIAYGRRGKGYLVGAFKPAAGEALTVPYAGRTTANSIEARPGDLICPALPFLFAKIVDEPYFILSDALPDPQVFQQAFGRAYEEYAHRLVKRISDADRGGRWYVKHGLRTRQGAEVADSYLQRGNVGLTFEHKGQRPGTDFIRGGQGERVLGPSDAVLTQLEQQLTVPLREGRDQDQGLFTRGMWQHSIAGQSLPSCAR